MSSKTSLSAPEVHTTLRTGVRQRTGVSKTAKGAMFLFARAGVVVSVVLAMKGRGSADAQAVVVTLTIYWTILAVTLVWMIDVFVRALRGHFKRRGVPLRGHVWRQYEELWSSFHNQLVFVKGSASRRVQRANPPE